MKADELVEMTVESSADARDVRKVELSDVMMVASSADSMVHSMVDGMVGRKAALKVSVKVAMTVGNSVDL